LDIERPDARVFIELRMPSDQLAQWHDIALQFLDKPLPPCAITVSHVLFAATQAASAETGVPTWDAFLEGRLAAHSEGGFSFRISSSWEDLCFRT
jgi:hypothetical protein